jgi:hypothetical protein
MEAINDICCWFNGTAIQYFLLAGAIGLVTAFAELLTRYNYDYRSILYVRIGWVYMAINAFAGVVAYFAVSEFELLPGKEWVRALVAGSSAMLVLRSSFVNIKNHDKQIDIGLASILHVFLSAANRGFSQGRSINRMSGLDFMREVDFDKAKRILPELCFISMKDVTDLEKKAIIDKIDEVNADSGLNANKSLLLGVILADITDIKMLKKAIETLGTGIKLDPSIPPGRSIDNILEELSKGKNS